MHNDKNRENNNYENGLTFNGHILSNTDQDLKHTTDTEEVSSMLSSDSFEYIRYLKKVGEKLEKISLDMLDGVSHEMLNSMYTSLKDLRASCFAGMASNYLNEAEGIIKLIDEHNVTVEDAFNRIEDIASQIAAEVENFEMDELISGISEFLKNHPTEHGNFFRRISEEFAKTMN